VRRIEQFTVNVMAVLLAALARVAARGQAHQGPDGDADQQPGEGLVRGGYPDRIADGRTDEHPDPQRLVFHRLRLASPRPVADVFHCRWPGL